MGPATSISLSHDVWGSIKYAKDIRVSKDTEKDVRQRFDPLFTIALFQLMQALGNLIGSPSRCSLCRLSSTQLMRDPLRQMMVNIRLLRQQHFASKPGMAQELCLHRFLFFRRNFFPDPNVSSYGRRSLRVKSSQPRNLPARNTPRIAISKFHFISDESDRAVSNWIAVERLFRRWVYWWHVRQ